MKNASAKLREALFFLRLLAQLEETGSPLLGSVHDTRDEFAFVLSAFLNACYAATEHLKSSATKAQVDAFKKLHPLMYGNGLRNLTVHERHISPVLTRYMAYAETGAPVSPPVLRSEYYFEPGEAPVHITVLCKAHYEALLEFALRFRVRPEALYLSEDRKEE